MTAIAGGYGHSLALKGDGSVVAWGCVGYDAGQCNVPSGLSGVTAIAAGDTHSLALVGAGTPASTAHFLQPLTETEAGNAGNPTLNTGKNGKVIPVKVQLTRDDALTDLNLCRSRLASRKARLVQQHGRTNPVSSTPTPASRAQARTSSAGTRPRRPGSTTWTRRRSGS